MYHICTILWAKPASGSHGSFHLRRLFSFCLQIYEISIYHQTKRTKKNRNVIKNDKRAGKEAFFSEAFGCCCQVPVPWQDAPWQDGRI